MVGAVRPVAAATDPQVWQGTLFVTTVTGACTTAAVAAKGDYYDIVYRPIIGTSQTGPEGLSLFGGRSTQHWYTDSATTSFQTSATANIIALGSHATRSTGTGAYSLSFKPATIALTTPSITFTGLLSNFWNVAGCNVTVTAALDKRVN